jgi:hypothetical protein
MNIDWDQTLDQILSRRLICPRCHHDQDALIVGYSRNPGLSPYAPRHSKDCASGDACNARKLVTLCVDCAGVERFRGELQRPGRVMAAYLHDCRHDLDELLNYLVDAWTEDHELGPDDLDRTLEEVDPGGFAQHSAMRQTLEEEYLRYHHALRERGRRIPDPAWRGEYVEEIIGLGYQTLLGD